MSQGTLPSDLPGWVRSSEPQAHVFPPSVPDWNNLKVLHRNTLPPRSHFFVYKDIEDARKGELALAKSQLLSGQWLFSLSKSPYDGTVDFYKYTPQELADMPGWGTQHNRIMVPGFWQLQGYGRGPQYVNYNYPFPVDPPRVPIDDNECGRYVTCFKLDPVEDKDHQIRLRFEGVDSAFTVWVNHRDVGYSQGARNPSEFDITSFVRFDGVNLLHVEVYQRCDGSYLEDQDQWRISGIFRDVWLHKFPKIHIEDFHVQTLLDDKYQDATLLVEVQLNGHATVELSLEELHKTKVTEENKKPEVIIVAQATKEGSGTITFQVPVANPRKWTAETPYLYRLILNVPGCVVAERVGFRKVELLDGVFCVNGQPVKLRGVNRHEHHPKYGRTVPYDFLEADLIQMKQYNVNAIRTSHYPNDYRLYELADELGLWILDEWYVNLTCRWYDQHADDPVTSSATGCSLLAATVPSTPPTIRTGRKRTSIALARW